MGLPLPKGARPKASLPWVWLAWLLPCVIALVCLISPPPQSFSEPTASRVQTQAKVKDTLGPSFIAFGDFGSGMAGQMRLAKQMASLHQKAPFSHALLLGDNIYPDGDIKHYGKERFEKPYLPLLESSVLFITALGNHDTLFGFEQDQIAFFGMPGPYYEKTIGPVHILVLNTNRFNKSQQTWLENRLKASTSPYKIVMGHHPVMSSGEHGATGVLVKNLQPLLEKYKVQLYICGHDHDYERFAPVKGVTYMVSGGGGASLRKFEKTQPGSVVRKSVYEFVHFQVKPEGLAFQTIQDNGTVIDSGLLK